MSVEVLSVRGLRPECGKVDRDLWLWFLEAKRDYKNYHGPRVTKRMVQNKAIQAFKDAGISGFKASDGWYVRWIKRWHRFGCENADADHDNAYEEPRNENSIKKKPVRSSRKTGKKLILSVPKAVSGGGCLPSQEPFTSSCSYPVDKLQILHDVASRELADSIYQEISTAETRNNVFQQPQLALEVSQTGRSDTGSLLDFDPITWNDESYGDKPELPSNTSTLYRIDENSLNYSSSVMSQMMEFAEICHLKEKEMQQHNLQDQVPKENSPQSENQRLCDDFHLIQPQAPPHCSETKTFSNISTSPCDTQLYGCSDSDFLPDNAFYSIDDSNFQILNDGSAFSQHHSVFQSNENVNNVQNNILLDNSYSAQIHVMKLTDPVLEKRVNSQTLENSEVLDKNYNSGQINIVKQSEKVLTFCGKDINSSINENSISDHMSITGLDCINVEECCTEQGSIGVLFGSNHQADQLNIVGINGVNFDERDLCSSRNNVNDIFVQNHSSNQIETVTSNSLNQNVSKNTNSDEHEISTTVCDVSQQSNALHVSTLNSVSVCKQKNCSGSNVNVTVDDCYQPKQVNIIELTGVNLDCVPSLPDGQEKAAGSLSCHEYTTSHVNIIELNDFNSVDTNISCSIGGENTVFDEHLNPDQVNIVELDSFNLTGSENMDDRVILHTDFQADQVNVIELNSLNLEETEVEGTGSADCLIAQSLLPCGGSDTHHSVLGNTSSESSLLLFTESPFSFNDDDEMPDVLPLSNSCDVTSSNQTVSVPVPTSDILALSKDGTDSDLDLVDSILDQVVRMEDQQNERLKTQSSDKATSTEEDIISKAVTSENDQRPPLRRLGGERYLPCFKRKVLEYAAQHTAKDAAKQFHVHANTVTLWSRNEEAKNPVKSVVPDQQMLTWLKRKRESGSLVTRSQVSSKARELLQTPGSWQKNKSRWFYVWGSRFADLEKAEAKNVESVGMEEKSSFVSSSFSKALYPDEFKLEVALFAEKTNQNVASSVFNIARKRVFEWVNSLKEVRKKKPEEEPEDHETLFISKGKVLGRALTSVTVDGELWDWFCEQTGKKKKPKSKEIRSKAVELFRAHNFEHIRCSHGWLKKWSIRHGIALRYEGDSDLLVWCLEQFDHNKNISQRDLLNQAYHVLTGTHKSDFKASAGWALRFCKRHRSLLSTRPSFEVDLPDELEDRVAEFRRLTQQLILSLKTSPESIGSMDEIPLNLTAGGSGGSRSRLLLRRSGFKNCHATVVLCCLADGSLLSPAIIFKGEGSPEWKTIDGMCVLVLHQEKSCMSTVTMQQWLQFIWLKNVASPSVLILDCFGPHSAESVRDISIAEKCHLTVIPAGCSSKLQPLDLSVTRQFEALIADRWAKHYASLDHFSSIKRTPYSSNTDIIRWVAEAHSKLQITRKDAIKRSFAVMGLTSDPTLSNEQNFNSSYSPSS